MDNYPYIPFMPEKKTVIRRLGSQKADFSANLEGEINDYLKKAQTDFSAAGKAKVYDIQHNGENSFTLEGYNIESLLLSRMLKNSDKVYLIGASIPQRDVDKISAAMQNGQGLKAIVFDAYASEYVDGTLDVIMDRKNAALKRTAQRLTKRRFSAGYGDLDIKYQSIFYELLDMKTLGVTINEHFLLSPEKSVIAIAGVE